MLPLAGILLIGRVLAQRFDYPIFHFLDTIRAFGLGFWFAESELRIRLLNASRYIFAFFPAAAWVAWIRINLERDRTTGAIRLDRPIFRFCSVLARRIRSSVRSPEDFPLAVPPLAPRMPAVLASSALPKAPLSAPLGGSVEQIFRMEPIRAAEPVLRSEPTLRVEPVVRAEPSLRPEPVVRAVPAPRAEPILRAEPIARVEPVAHPEPIRRVESPAAPATPVNPPDDVMPPARDARPSGGPSLRALPTRAASAETLRGIRDPISIHRAGISDPKSLINGAWPYPSKQLNSTVWKRSKS